jgi:hypothetical protein
LTHSLKAPGFNPRAYKVKNRFQSLLSKCNLCRYNEFWRKRRPDITLLMLNSRVVAIIRQVLLDYRARLCNAGYGPFTGGNTPSSGWVGVYLATQLCAKVNVYGFGVGEVGGKDVTYHYYQGYAARKFGTDVHSFDTETHLIKAGLYKLRSVQVEFSCDP